MKKLFTTLITLILPFLVYSQVIVCYEMNVMKTKLKEYEVVFVGEEEHTKNWIGIYSSENEYMVIEWSALYACVLYHGKNKLKSLNMGE